MSYDKLNRLNRKEISESDRHETVLAISHTCKVKKINLVGTIIEFSMQRCTSMLNKKKIEFSIKPRDTKTNGTNLGIIYKLSNM